MIEQRSAGISRERLFIRSKPIVLTNGLQTAEHTASDNGSLDVDSIGASRLLDWVSTDQIIPSVWCMQYSDPENLGKYLLTGVRGINPGDIQNSSADTLVVGKSFGRGSSREHAQLALKGAGIKFVIAESAERIFRENCRNYGIFVLPSVSEVSRKLIRGEMVELDDILSHYDKLSQDIYRAGGLLPYTRSRLEGYVRLPLVDTAKRPMTIAEKIIAKNTRVNGIGDDGVIAVKPGDVLLARVDKKYAYELQTIISQKVLNDTFGESAPVNNTNTWLFEDHLALMPHDVPVTVRHRDAQRAFAEKYGITEYRAGRDGVEGICHTVMLENHVLPGELVLGNDSHTCHLGAVNALAVGKGASEFAAALITGDIPLQVPETIKVNLRGKLKEGITSKDLMLNILSRRDLKDELIASNRVLQFGGEALEEMELDDQTVLTNMAIEGQAFTGIIEPNKKIIEFVIEKHGMQRKDVEAMLVYPDPDATYFDVLDIDLENIQRMVALPGDTQNAVPIEEIRGTKINFAYIGSCTGGKLKDLREVAAVLKGRKISGGVEMQIQASSKSVYEKAKDEGLIEIFNNAGAKVIGQGCGNCMGATEEARLRVANAITSTNRSFEHRMGKNTNAYLASPAVVAASAVIGEICAPEDLIPVN